MTALFYDVHIEDWLKQIAGPGSARTSSSIKPPLHETDKPY
jgi:hypothetical protein